MDNLALTPTLAEKALEYLGCAHNSPSIRYLNQLIRAYLCHVPWESVTRIIKRHSTPKTADCPRWPEEFWNDALELGAGGTCFENNLAFHALLVSLGFQGYLTVNDMADRHACHTANIVTLQGRKYLVDVAIPLHCALPVCADRVTRRSTRFHYYTVRPSGEAVFEIARSHHPKRYIFTLLDTPVRLDAYRAAVARDYGAQGYFLDYVIIVKVVGNRLWRFSSIERPYCLEGFDKTSRQAVNLSPESLSEVLAGHFGLRASSIAEAMALVPRG
ncbi:MAG: arylamine N-acetyltransferase [Anaerolineae bacterium]|nr:arylamine N-acetyltransferase [Anaerolineae bacterium]